MRRKGALALVNSTVTGESTIRSRMRSEALRKDTVSIKERGRQVATVKTTSINRKLLETRRTPNASWRETLEAKRIEIGARERQVEKY